MLLGTKTFSVVMWNCGEPRRCRDSKQGPCLMAKKTKTKTKTWRQVPNQGRELTWTVQAKGGPLGRMKACLYGTSRGQTSGYTDVDGEELGLSWENNFHVCTGEHGLFLRWLSISCCFICYSVFLSLSWLFTYYFYFPFLFSCGDLWFNKVTTII